MAELMCSNCGKGLQVDSATIGLISRRLREAMEKREGAEMEAAVKFECKHCGTENIIPEEEL